MKSDLDFEKQRATEFEEKYKSSIRYKNEEEEMKRIMSELNFTISNKENQILQQVKTQQERKKKISELTTINQELLCHNQELKQQLAQIQQGAIAAIVEKDSIIADLEEKINQLQISNDTGNLQTIVAELGERYKDLQEKSQAEKNQLESLIENRQTEINDLHHKLDLCRERYQERISTLEQDIIQYEKHIDKINQEKHYEESLEHRYVILEQKQLKTEKKLHDQQNSFKNQREEYYEALKKMEGQISSLKQQNEGVKNYQSKIKQAEKQTKKLKKENQQLKASNQKVKASLEEEKQKYAQVMENKSQQIQRLKVQFQQKSQAESKKEASEELAQIQNFKKMLKDNEQTIESLNKALENQTKQVQRLRETMVSKSGSASRSQEEQKLLIQIQDLNSHVKKFQHDLLLKKLSYAEDQNHWKETEAKLKKQIQNLEKKCKKERGQLLERINQIKNQKKEKKLDYYQSSLK